jgi:predicted tellurium resistance membrane protein TerC
MLDLAPLATSQGLVALAMLFMIGVLLLAEGFGVHFERGYVYFGMFFAAFVEALNIAAGKRHKARRTTPAHPGGY